MDPVYTPLIAYTARCLYMLYIAWPKSITTWLHKHTAKEHTVKIPWFPEALAPSHSLFPPLYMYQDVLWKDKYPVCLAEKEPFPTAHFEKLPLFSFHHCYSRF